MDEFTTAFRARIPDIQSTAHIRRNIKGYARSTLSQAIGSITIHAAVNSGRAVQHR